MSRPPGAPPSPTRRKKPATRLAPALRLEALRAGLRGEAFDLTVSEGETVTAYGTD